MDAPGLNTLLFDITHKEAGAPAELVMHVRAMLAVNNIRWEQAASEEEMIANSEERLVRTLPVVDIRSYYMALHEIGHVVLEHPPFTPWRQGLSRESEAWRFAAHNALVQVDEATIAEMRESLDSYRSTMLLLAASESSELPAPLPPTADIVADIAF